jgi:tyrosyl-tRNA synthetase
LEEGVWIIRLLIEAGLSSSKSEARRLIQQGGAYLNDQPISDENREITNKDLVDGGIVLRAGKKRYKQFIFV